jgi:ribonucleotide monophosphatase NagD (HAD superfamily)
MEKQQILKEKVLQDVTLLKDLKAVKEALEIQKLKEEIIGRILLENDKERLRELAGSLNSKGTASIKTESIITAGNPLGHGNG